jgi:hypothetical protein
MNEAPRSAPSLTTRAIAVIVLLVAGWILLHLLIGIAVAIASVVVVIVAIIAAVWAARVLL